MVLALVIKSVLAAVTGKRDYMEPTGKSIIIKTTA